MTDFTILENRDKRRVAPWELPVGAYSRLRNRAINNLPGGGNGVIIDGTVFTSNLLQFINTAGGVNIGLSPMGVQIIEQIALGILPPPPLDEVTLGGILNENVILEPQTFIGGQIPFPFLSFASPSGDAYNNGFVVNTTLARNLVVVPVNGTYKIDLRLSLGAVIIDRAVQALEFAVIRINVLRTRFSGPTEVLMSEVSEGGQFFEFAIEASADLQAGDILSFEIVAGPDILSIEVEGREPLTRAGRTSLYITQE